MLHTGLHVNQVLRIYAFWETCKCKGEYAILPQPFNYMAEGFYVELGKKRSDKNNWIRVLFQAASGTFLSVNAKRNYAAK